MNVLNSKGSIIRKIFAFRQISILVILIFICIYLSITTSSFLSASNMLNVLRQTTTIMIVACGMTYILILGEIDLSIGSIACLIGTLVAGFIGQNHIPVIPSFILGLILGTLLGSISGILVAKIHIPSFIATLAMMSTARGLALVYSGGYPITNMPKFALFFGRGYIGIIPVPVIIMLVVIGISWGVLALTKFGRYTYAIGGNAECAKLSGVGLDKIKIIVFAISGFTASLTGILLTMRLASSQPTLGDGMELDAITAVVLGGTLLTGGRGSMAGTIIGSLFLNVLGNGLNIIGINSFWQQVIKGIVLILAVCFYEVRGSKK
jgi:ribose transport system permease protein